MTRGIRLIALLTVSSMALAGCTALPTETEPEALRSFEPEDDTAPDVGPEPGREPDLLLHDFYVASAIPTGEHEQARSFLTPEAASRWEPTASTLIVDRLDITTQPESTSEKRIFAVRGSGIATLQPGGSYVPENSSYEATIEMELVDDEWRISSLPSGVVIERTELRNNYEPHNLYFFAPGGELLVGDRRWVFAGEEQVDVVLISMILEGASPVLRPAVAPAVPAGVQFVGEENGAYHFTGLQDMDARERSRFAAQLTWTLSGANIPAPYSFVADGSPLIEGAPSVTPDTFAEYNPQASVSDVTPLYALTDGQLFVVSSDEVEPTEGPVGQWNDVESADISAEGTAAAVRSSGDEDSLYLADSKGWQTEALTAETITRPTFEADPDTVWVALNGSSVQRVVRSETTGEVSRTEVETSEVDEIGGNISMLRLSRTGARVAMVIDGRLFTGVVDRPEAGVRAIVNVQELAPDLGGTVMSLDWQPDGSLLVGTSVPEAPVWRVEQDGSSVSALPSGNLSAPVVAVAASATTMYATDARAILQLPASGGDNTMWREVPGLQGVRSAPIVAK